METTHFRVRDHVEMTCICAECGHEIKKGWVIQARFRLGEILFFHPECAKVAGYELVCAKVAGYELAGKGIGLGGR